MLDIHTHNPAPDLQAVIDLSAPLLAAVKEGTFSPEALLSPYSDMQRFSIGIHPWSLGESMPESLPEAVEKMVALPQCALVGETGIDTVKGGPLFRQMNTFRSMILLSEKYRKPLIIHDVKAHDIIIGVYRDLRPAMPWIIHGFRQKPSVAEMMLGQGFLLSFGPGFNPLTLRGVPSDTILAESDDSDIPIQQIIHNLSDARGHDLTELIEANCARIIPPLAK